MAGNSHAVGNRDFSRRAWLSAGAPILVLVLVVIMLACAVVAGFARRQDQDFIQESSRLAQSVLEGRARALSNLTLDYAMWNDAYERISLRRDPTWIDENFYSSVADGLVLFRADGAISYVWLTDEMGGEQGPLGPESVRAALADMTLPRPDGVLPTDLLADSMFTHAGGLVLMSVAPVSSEDAAVRTGRTVEQSDYLAIVEVLEAEELAELGRNLSLDEFRFTTGRAEPGRIALPLGAASGRPIGALSWRDKKPGSEAFLGQMWPIVLSLMIVGALTLLVARRLVSAYVQTSARAEAALEASRLKSEFIATMSHELRTPLNAIIGYAEMIQEEAEPVGERVIAEDAARVVNAAKHLRQLISDILDQSRIDAGRMPISIDRVPVAGVLADVIELATPMARANGNTLSAAELAPGLEALADDVRIRQCLLNLVGAAAKASAQTAIAVTAQRETRESGDVIVFDVAAEGAVAPAAPLAQVDDDASHYGGAGLGLSIASKLARAMGGEVAAEEGRAAYRLTVPAAPDAMQQAA